MGFEWLEKQGRLEIPTRLLGVKVLRYKPIKEIPVAVIRFGEAKVPLAEFASSNGRARRDPPNPWRNRLRVRFRLISMKRKIFL